MTGPRARIGIKIDPQFLVKLFAHDGLDVRLVDRTANVAPSVWLHSRTRRPAGKDQGVVCGAIRTRYGHHHQSSDSHDADAGKDAIDIERVKSCNTLCVE